jgi:hypothetical protein
MVRIRQIKTENVKLFENVFSLKISGYKSKFYRQIILSPKKVPSFCISEITSIYKVTSVRIVEIEEDPPPLEEDRRDLD